MRGGTYQQGQIFLKIAGTAWSNGNFNTLMSYPGEWAVIDGVDTITTAIGGGWPGIITDNALSRPYWHFDHFEITRGKDEGTDATSAFQFWSGHLWFSHLYVHDNWHWGCRW